MRSGRFPWNSPYLLKPIMVFIFCHPRRIPLFFGRLPIASRFAKHEYKFHVVFYDSIWFVRLPQKAARSIFNLESRVRYLVPENWIEIIESNFPAAHDDVGVKRHHHMPAMPA